MSFRSRGGGGSFGFGRGGRGGGGRAGGFSRGSGGGFRVRGGGLSGGRGGFNRYQPDEPPEQVMPFAHFTHPCGNDLVLKVEMEDVPYFNAPVYLENKEPIGKIDEIFGGLHDFWVSVKLSGDIKAGSFKVNDKFYIDPAKILPLKRFLPQPPGEKGGAKRGKPDRGGGRGGRGCFSRGGRGGDRNSFGGRGGGRGRCGGRSFSGGGGGGGRFTGGGRGGFNRR